MNRPFLKKVRELSASWEDAHEAPLPEQPEEVDGLDALFQRLEERPYRKPDSQTGRLIELTELMNNFSLEELADFFTALLLEDPELMDLPLFPETLHISKSEASYDWLMNLPYSTMAKARGIFESLFEAALNEEYGPEGSVAVIQKVKALTAKNHAGLPFEYLERKVRSGSLSPGLRLELAQLMVLHEAYDLDFSAVESLFSVQKTPYMLPALMEAYLRGGLDGAKQALLALNQFKEKDFPVRAVELMPGMIYMLEEVARSFRKAFPADWKKQLSRFVHEELEIANSWLRELVAEELGVAAALHVEEPMEKEPGESSAIPAEKVSKPLTELQQRQSEITLEPIDLRNEIPRDLLQLWAIAAERNREQRGRLYEAVAHGIRQYGELASRNARNLLFYLKENTNINLEEELRGWRVKLTFLPYQLIDLVKYPELEGLNISEERPEDENEVIGKAMGEAKVHEELELSLF